MNKAPKKFFGGFGFIVWLASIYCRPPSGDGIRHGAPTVAVPSCHSRGGLTSALKLFEPAESNGTPSGRFCHFLVRIALRHLGKRNRLDLACLTRTAETFEPLDA